MWSIWSQSKWGQRKLGQSMEDGAQSFMDVISDYYCYGTQEVSLHIFLWWGILSSNKLTFYVLYLIFKQRFYFEKKLSGNPLEICDLIVNMHTWILMSCISAWIWSIYPLTKQIPYFNIDLKYFSTNNIQNNGEIQCLLNKWQSGEN